MNARIIGYFLAPYCPAMADHVIIVFDVLDGNGACHLAFSPTEGLCFFTTANFKHWTKITVTMFRDLTEGYPVPPEFFDTTSMLSDVYNRCKEYTTKISGRCGIVPDKKQRSG
jgi:hypothetical protein